MNKQLEQVSRVTTDCLSFTWNIENFSSLNAKPGQFVRSCTVKCSDAQWCLKLFPNGKLTPNEVEIYLEKVGFTSLPSIVEFKIGLRNSSGENCFEVFDAIPKDASNENKFNSSAAARTSSESVTATLTADVSSSCKEPDETLKSTTVFPAEDCSPSFATFDCTSPEKATTASSFSSFLSLPVTTTAPGFFAKTNCTSRSTTTSDLSDSLIGSTSSPKTSTPSIFSFSGNETSSSMPSTSTMFSFASNTTSSFDSKNYFKPVETKVKNATQSLSKTNLSSDAKARSIQPLPRIFASISTKAPALCCLNEKEKTPGSVWESKSLYFAEENQKLTVSRELLFKMAGDLLPDDVLTVVCEMEVTIVLNVSELTLVNEGASTRDGSRLLTKNLQVGCENPRFSDVKLKLGDIEFPAHKIILANRSKVFDGMFDGVMEKSKDEVVNLVEMKPSTAKDMLGYIYAGTIQELSMDRAKDLYVVADIYDMPELKQWCKAFLLKHLSPDHVCDVAVLANLHGDEDLAKASKRTIKNNLKTVLISEKWLSFSKQSPAAYLEMLQVALLDESD